MRHVSHTVAAVFLPGALFVGCLPGDTRPPPGHLLVTVTASDATLTDPVPTDDGFALAFDRYLVSIADDRIGDACNVYYRPRYGRVLSLLVPGAQKLNLFYGLGACDFSFSMAPPAEHVLPGARVSQDDLTVFRTPGGDPYSPVAGVSVEVQGRATQGATTVTFHWLFRRSINFGDCALPNSDPTQAVALAADTDATFNLLGRGEALFRDGVQEGAKLRFAAIASADSSHGDGNGDVTLDELQKITIAEARADGGYTIDPAAAGALAIPPMGITTLLDFIYFATLPRILRYRDTGACSVKPGDDHRDRGGG